MITPLAKYSHSWALFAYVKASLMALSRNLSSMVFGFLFPFIFILIFGFMDNRALTLDIGVAEKCEQNNPVFEKLMNMKSLRMVIGLDDQTLYEKLKKGELDAVVKIVKSSDSTGQKYILDVTTSNAAVNHETFLTMMRGVVAEIILDSEKSVSYPVAVKIEKIEGRKYKAIDFILPGQLGFVIISSGVFGAAYVLITLKQRLIIKRLLATPVRPITILLGESISRLIFSMTQVAVIVLLGTYLFDFTLIHGFVTLLPMLVVCVIGLLVFFGFGMIVSQIAKNEHAVPPISNLLVLPQALLSGTFFSIQIFPDWLQSLCRLLPLTHVNDALRKISFDGAGLTDVVTEMAALVTWGVIVFAVNVRIFKWE
jgi:ABC-2 type transport system permease protein